MFIFDSGQLMFKYSSQKLHGLDVYKRQSQGMLSKIEKGLFKPSEDFLLSIYDFLNFPISFFEQKDQLFDPNLTFYRKRVTVKKITQLSAEGRMNLVRMHVERLMKSVELPELNLPTWDVEEQGEPTNAAIWLRRSWGLPKGRIENLTKVVEDNGIVVISFNFGTEKMDGLSMQTKDKQPLIFINKAISGDRQRFTCLLYTSSTGLIKKLIC